MKITRLWVALVVATLVLGCTLKAHAQTVGIQMGVPQFFDNNGKPLNGGKLYSYVAGTATPLFLYTNKELNVPYTDPMVLNSSGRPSGPVYMQNLAYKLVLTTSAGVTIWTADYQYPSSLIGGGWATDLTSVHTVPTNMDVIIGTDTDTNVGANGQLHVVGTALRVYSDSTPNSNYTAIRVTGSAVVYESLINGTATLAPMQWRVGCGTPCMTLDTSATTAKLTLGTNAGTYSGILSVVSLTSSATYSSQGVTANTAALTSLTSQTASIINTANTLPLYIKRPTGSEVGKFETSNSAAQINLWATGIAACLSTACGTISSSALAMEISNPVAPATMGVYSPTACGLTGSCFIFSGTISNAFIVDETNSAVALNILVYHGGALQRVLLGAADSCTAGYRCLRVPN